MTTPARHRAPVQVGRRRRRFLAVAVTALVLGVGGAGHAFWTASSTGSYAKAQAATLTAPTVTAGSVTATSVALGWSTSFSPTALTLAQSSGSLGGCSASPAAASTGCTATGLTPNTSYTWTLTAARSSWTSAGTVTATTSRQSTSTTLSNLTPPSGSQGSSFAATATVAGYGTPAGTVVFSLFTDSACSGAASYTTSALTLSGGAVTGSLQPTAGTYYWRGTYTPSDAYNLASTSACSAAITVAPPTSTIGFNYYNVNAALYDGQGHPTGVSGGLSLINQGGSAPRTLTAFTVTISVPDSRFSGSAPTGVTGVGWSYTGRSHVGSEWVYAFAWTGSLDVWSSTDSLTYTLAASDTSSGSFNNTAVATNVYSNSPSWTVSVGF